MCPACRREVTSSKHKCSRCGKHIGDSDSTGFVNPNFDSSRFERLSNDHTDDGVCEEVEEDI